MEEFYQKNKKALKILSFILGLFLLYILVVNVDGLDSSKSDKKVEIENVILTGYQKGLLSWLLKAKYVWSAYSIDHSVVENIYDGQLYDNGKVVLKNFSARKVNVNAPQERLYADEGIKALLIRRIKNKEDRYVDIWAEQLQYFAQDKKSYIQQKVKIKDEEIAVEATSAQIDHTNNTVEFGKDFVLTNERSRIIGDSLLVQINEQLFTAKGNVELLCKADRNSRDEFKKKDTKVFCDKLTLKSVSGNTEAFLYNDIKIWQEDKQGFGDYCLFNDRADQVLLSGNAGVIFDKSDWLLDQKTIAKVKNKEAKQTVYERLTMRGDELHLSTKSKDLNAKGNVFVGVKNKEARSEQAVYNRKDEKIYMTGKVSMKKADGSTIQAGKVIIDINTEKFSALGQAESTIILKR